MSSGRDCDEFLEIIRDLELMALIYIAGYILGQIKRKIFL